ncbi:MAG: ABC transporter substrate-binding protein [Actinomycetota bacterium]|nr:ABC transporter substrate-binding protein [Actinomycetota bacterium]
MQRSRVRRVGALVLGLSLVAAACGDDDDESADTEAPTAQTDAGGDTTMAGGDTTEGGADTTEGGADTTTGGSDSTAAGGGEQECGFAPSDVTDGEIAGFAGTTPAGEISEEFFARLCEVDPELEDLNYAAETYDAVMIIALATLVAGDDGIAMASEINGVTRDGEKCTAFADCAELIEAGTDIDYDGASGPLTFDGNGEPLEVSYGLFKFGDNNRIDPTLTEYIAVSAVDEPNYPEEVPVEGTRAGDGVLTIGSILPQTGSLAFLGPPEFAGFDLAVDEINEGGGVLGQDLVGIPGDSGDTSTDTANQTVDRLLAQDVDAIIGAASSSVTQTVIDKVTNAGVVLFSPANTSTVFTDYDDNGLYFRTAPPDVFQGDVLGQFIVNDGNQSVAFMVLNDDYGTSLLAQAKATIEDSGGSVVVEKIYDPQADSFDSEIDEIVAADPDAIVVIGFNESSRILRTMVEKGVGPRDLPVYGSDGNIGNALGVDFDAGN